MTVRIPLRIERPHETTREDLEVHCARRAMVVPLAACLACEHCSGLTIDTSGGTSFVACDGPSPEIEFVDEVETRPASSPEDGLAAALETTPVSSVMTEVPVCVRIDADLESLVETFRKENVCALPVVDWDGSAIGVVSKIDVILFLARREQAAGAGRGPRESSGVTVGDVVTPLVHTVPESTSLGMAVATMAAGGVHALPVTRNDRVVGIISALDVLEWLATRAGYFDDRRARRGRDS